MSGSATGRPGHFEPTLGKVVVEKKRPQILRMHAEGHACRIGVPGHDIDWKGLLAHQVVVNAARPDQIVRSRYLERPGHLPGVEIAALPHHVFEKRDLALVDEEHQFAGLGEVDLGGEQAQARQPLVAVARHGRGCNCEQRSAEAIADCVHLCGRQ